MAELDDKVIVTKSKITDIADALREEMSESNEYSLPTMVQKVHELGQGQGSEYTGGVGIDITNRVVSVVDTLMIRGSANGSVASIDDGGNDMPLKSCTVAIEPVQSGSGDPSPSNVRPISGWTEMNLNVKSENILTLANASGTYNNVDYTINNGVITLNGICNASGNINLTTTFYLKANEKYSMCDFAEGTFPNNTSTRLQLYKVGSIDISTLNNSASNYVVSGTCQMSTNATLRIRVASGHNYSNCKLKPMIAVGEVSAMNYAPYNANLYNIEFKDGTNPLTVYGGTLDVVSGVLTVTKGYIASYNGETLPSTWISDRDVYAEGTTPTTGAEVVYELATPITYNLTPTEIKTLLGINNIFADTGDIENVEYTRDATSIINWLISQINLGA